MAKLVLENLTKDFGKVRAVNNMTLEVADGEFLVMLGPSGAGKTTTLKMIGGVETPSSGKVYIGDKLMNAIEPHHRKVAMAFESYALYPHFTVAENLAFPLKAPGRNTPPAEIEQRVKSISELLNIQMLLDRLPQNLSNGQKQRVALGRAMVREPDVLLLDEPISHLDAKLRHRMRTEFKALESAIRSTTVYVTHDYLEAMSLGDRLVVLNKGEIQQIGHPQEVFNKPINTFVAQLLGHPQINLLNTVVQRSGDALQLVGGEGRVRIDVPATLHDPLIKTNLDKVLVGVRPLHAHVIDAGQFVNGSVASGMVYVYERLGTKGVLTAMVTGQKMEIITPIEHDFTIDAPVTIGIESENIMIFDPITQKNILFA